MNMQCKSLVRRSGLAVAGMVAAMAFHVTAAQAEVVWSVGVHEPGLNVRVSNAPVVRPVLAPVPVVMQPVYYYPVYQLVQPVVYPAGPHLPPHAHGKAKGHWKHPHQAHAGWASPTGHHH